MSSAAVALLAQLRHAKLRTASATCEVRRLPLGLPPIDEALSGGVPRGRVLEIIGARGSGRLSTTVCAIAEAQRAGEWVALIDVADAFDPRTAAPAGVALSSLLWVRPTTLLDGIKAADLLLDAGGFGLVVLYTCGVERRIRAAAFESFSVRLARRAERAQSVLLVIGDAPLIATSSVAGRLHVRREHAIWQDHLLEALDARLELERSRLGPQKIESVVRLSVA